MCKTVSGIKSKVQCFKIANEHDLALDVIPVLHVDAIPQTLFPLTLKTNLQWTQLANQNNVSSTPDTFEVFLYPESGRSLRTTISFRSKW